MNQKVWGHRGRRGAGNPPENSLGAFEYALDAGAGGIELDVYLSADGVPVVFHDDSLERMVGRAGEVSALALSEIKKLQLLTLEGRTSPETIPTLTEVLDLVDKYRAGSRTLVVNIELKDQRSGAAVASIVWQRIENGWLAQNFLVSSFDMTALRAFKTIAPAIPLGTLFECEAADLAAKMRDTDDIKPSTINIPATSLTPAVFDLIHSVGATPIVWTPSEKNPDKLAPAERAQLIKNIREHNFVSITDFPKEILHWLIE